MESDDKKSKQLCATDSTTKEKPPEKEKSASESQGKVSEKDGLDLAKSVEEKPPETTEESADDSPFALQSFLDVPDFEFMGADGSYQQPFH